MNAPLRKALAEAQLTETDVAAHLGVDPKTVRRWLSGQRPYPRHSWALANLLQTEEDTLWPRDSQEPEAGVPLPKELQRVYAHRWQVPRETWLNLFISAEQEIGMLVYSGLFIADDAGIMDILRDRAKSGVNIRILLADPRSQQVKQRGKEESLGEIMAARVQNSLLLFRPLKKLAGVEIKMHSTTLYNSIYFSEKRVIANHHTYGLAAGESPVLEVDRAAHPGVSNVYVHSFDRTWINGNSITEDTE